MSEYIFRDASGYGCKPGEYERNNNIDHYGTLHEEIVRCRDCTNKQPYDEPMGCDCLCGLLWIEVEPDGFCKWGERK